ncbi:hypothetical protein AWB81_05865 [Caballeronia arationis]|uniref:hypothetical protein n=1 Tax=Caballeronia arationis TaxID=1777142 RepID=UPI00074BC7B0|nr:hypothetical protein [Caballeronia arationis]SAL00266.1 hypothetical protein AWB81_05865 [Caballeronia arationis]
MLASDEADRARHDREYPVAKLFDANSKFVGRLVTFDSYNVAAGVVLNVQGVLVYASISPILIGNDPSATEMKWSGNPGLFAGSNCSGDAYIRSAVGPLRPTALARSGATATLYVGSAGPKQLVTARSQGTGPENCYSESPFETQAWTVESTFDLTQHYPEPLRVGY